MCPECQILTIHENPFSVTHSLKFEECGFNAYVNSFLQDYMKNSDGQWKSLYPSAFQQILKKLPSSILDFLYDLQVYSPRCGYMSPGVTNSLSI